MTTKAQRRMKKRTRRLFSEIRKRLREGEICDAAVLYAKATGQLVSRKKLAIAVREGAVEGFIVGMFASGSIDAFHYPSDANGHQGAGDCGFRWAKDCP